MKIQEFIPVGCVPTTTRYQYPGMSAHCRGCQPKTGGCLLRGLPTRGSLPSVNRQTGIKTLPSADLKPYQTRMHSSRMRTTRLLTVSCTIRWWVSAQGGVCLGVFNVTLPPWTEFLTQDCENITFPQLLLQAVITTLANQLR